MLQPSLSAVYRGLIPFVIINLIVLAIVSYVPELSLVLLRWLR
jgi:TRAP-type C4-dicarboxylate transport system permease large subunit